MLKIKKQIVTWQWLSDFQELVAGYHDRGKSRSPRISNSEISRVQECIGIIEVARHLCKDYQPRTTAKDLAEAVKKRFKDDKTRKKYLKNIFTELAVECQLAIRYISDQLKFKKKR